MSEDSKDGEFNVERALHDAMDIVCKYSSAKALTTIAKVCTLWRSAALREKMKRCYIQQLTFPYADIGNLTNLIKVIPCVSLLIYELSLEKLLNLPIPETWLDEPNGFDRDLLRQFERKCPNDAIVLMMDKFITTEDVELESLIDHPEILGFFVPSVEGKIDIQFVSCISYDEMHRNRLGTLEDYYVDSLLWKTCDLPKSTLLLLASYRTNSYHPALCQLSRWAQSNNKQVTLASVFGRKLRLQDTNRKCAILRISGPNVESWSTFIYYRARPPEIESKLQTLKEQVKSNKGHYIAMVFSCNCVQPECDHEDHPINDGRELLRNLKRIFPNIRFLGFFINMLERSYKGLTSLQYYLPDRNHENISFTDEGFLNELFMYTSIIIISYD